MAQAIELLLSRSPKALLVNIFGGITRCDDVARAIVKVATARGGLGVPAVVRLVGTNEQEGVSILREHSLEAYSAMAEAAAAVVKAAAGGNGGGADGHPGR
jgi:succinyl-CoA synthetase beta subunit